MVLRLVAVTSGLGDVERLLNRVGDASHNGVAGGAARATLRSQSIVRGRARGRPGPRAVTGDFNRTIVGEYEVLGNDVFAQIGSSAAQALRLEFGFYGTDVLGRSYNQPPYPYLGPSVPDVQAAFTDEISASVRRSLGG